MQIFLFFTDKEGFESGKLIQQKKNTDSDDTVYGALETIKKIKKKIWQGKANKNSGGIWLCMA